jgi:segregation and condensation protein A
MQQQTYQVQLPAFEGPLDLLLYLIEQQELDITTIALAQVTDQYLAYLHRASEIGADDLADFVSIAARLLLIKSRVLLPLPPQESEEEEDVGEELVRRLRDYRRLKEAVRLLQERDAEGHRAFPRTAPPPRQPQRQDVRLDLDGISLDDLIATLQNVLQDQPVSSPGWSVVPHQVTIDDKIARISELLRSQDRLRFGSLLEDTGSRVEIIVTLLAILEMIRDLRVSVRQDRLFGEIWILPGESRAGSSGEER